MAQIKKTESGFSFFDKAINVLIVDDTPFMVDTLRDHLEGFKLYNIFSASSASEALKILSSPETRIHVCLYDLGIYDLFNNEFYLVEKFGKTIPFIVISSRQEIEIGGESILRGARENVDKASTTFYDKIIFLINKYALMNMICPKYREGRDSVICRLVEVLFEKAPLHVHEWALLANIDERQFRREWEKALGGCAYHSLCIYHLFSNMFEKQRKLSENSYIRAKDMVQGYPAFRDDEKSYERFIEYYNRHKKEIDTCIFGPVLLS
jgi:CheY-like chemotaxis protein